MEREISEITMLGVTLMSIAILLGAVSFTVTLGNNIKHGVFNKVDSINNSSATAILDSLIWEETEMPAAALYNIAISNIDSISEMKCNICNTVNNHLETQAGVSRNIVYDICLKDHLKGRVKITVQKTSNAYEIIVDESKVR